MSHVEGLDDAQTVWRSSVRDSSGWSAPLDSLWVSGPQPVAPVDNPRVEQYLRKVIRTRRDARSVLEQGEVLTCPIQWAKAVRRWARMIAYKRTSFGEGPGARRTWFLSFAPYGVHGYVMQEALRWMDPWLNGDAYRLELLAQKSRPEGWFGWHLPQHIYPDPSDSAAYLDEVRLSLARAYSPERSRADRIRDIADAFQYMVNAQYFGTFNASIGFVLIQAALTRMNEPVFEHGCLDFLACMMTPSTFRGIFESMLERARTGDSAHRIGPMSRVAKARAQELIYEAGWGFEARKRHLEWIEAVMTKSEPPRAEGLLTAWQVLDRWMGRLHAVKEACRLGGAIRLERMAEDTLGKFPDRLKTLLARPTTHVRLHALAARLLNSTLEQFIPGGDTTRLDEAVAHHFWVRKFLRASIISAREEGRRDALAKTAERLALVMPIKKAKALEIEGKYQNRRLNHSPLGLR